MTVTTLAYIPSPDQGVWFIGSVPLRAYALCIIAGIVAALVIGDRRWAARGGERGVIYDIALWAVPFGLVGGRLYHVMTDWPTYFGEGGAGLVAAFRIWDGGLGIWGAVALGAVGAWIGCRQRGIPLPAFGDAIAPGIILAQAIGRLGNYFNQELYGRATTVPWGLEIYERRDAAGFRDTLNGVSTGQVIGVVHPTFLYELLWNLLVFALLIWADRRFNLGHGRLFALYVAGYCVGRFCVELLRSDTATLIAGIRINSFTSTFVFIGAVVYIMVAPKGREAPETLVGKQAQQVSVDDLDTTVIATAGAAGGATAAVAVADPPDTKVALDEQETEVAEAADRADVDEVAVETAVLEIAEPDGEPEQTDDEVEGVDVEGSAEAEAADEFEVEAEAVEDMSVEDSAFEEGEPAAEAAADDAAAVDEDDALPSGPEAELLAVTGVEPDSAGEVEVVDEADGAAAEAEAVETAEDKTSEASVSESSETESAEADSVPEPVSESADEGEPVAETAADEDDALPSGPEAELLAVTDVEPDSAGEGEVVDDADGAEAEAEAVETAEDEAAADDAAAADEDDALPSGPEAELLAVTDVEPDTAGEVEVVEPTEDDESEPSEAEPAESDSDAAEAAAEEPATEAGEATESESEDSTKADDSAEAEAAAAPDHTPFSTTPLTAREPRKRFWQRRR
ncbi:MULTISPECIES: prolipoprotein diacylglyceryl transferase [Mycobacteriaceae]|uniref:Phosphatidylglycerol--prolipoprotein diacylglyceryl transferase n=1 Tax=Mycolicibacterium neoaurum VKM Ac-1815D TaxID=700508 RepID=V5XCU7_MYCNE|nr:MULTISPECIES: prolipoprotein diacylglyceryl transferase [Mycobacteriaceae]AHC25628.1 diacylglyceryl transferase [Mycolicibacterium neoaurum VKM Ac-1815D]AMO06072.1 diacylglyceryl transferase [Mycolicibacterium neoaurum]KJQ50416.1 diacylglyceryl transferase [Mycolicibacterium neoaurum]KUM09593.1 prolipoprotein diacylglyceryl transferase [Mycolicibacterium neoaurum]